MLDFSLSGRRTHPPTSRKALERSLAVLWEPLENRQLLSASLYAGPDHRGPGGGRGGPGDQGPSSTIEFSQAPTAVQTGLDTLATTDSVTAPVATSTIHLGNVGGVETYTYDTDSTGTDSKLTVDQTGAALTAPTISTTTYGAITNTAVTNEITAIATALDLTAPTSTTNVYVLRASDGSAVYSLSLSPATTTSTDDDHPHNAMISVDSNGNPAGHEQVPLSVLSTVIQTGLTSNAPSGATALAATSLIDVNTLDGTTLYTAHFTSTGTQTSVTVNTAGTLTSLPSVVQSTFGDIPMAAQTELQALATADGFTGTIDATLAVTESIEVNGTVIYTIRLPITSTDTTAEDITLTLSVDALGNPTVPPRDGPHRDAGGDRPGDDDDDDSGNTSNSGSTSSSNGDCDNSGTSSTGSTDSSGSTSSSGSSDTSNISSNTGSTTASTAAAVTTNTSTSTTTTVPPTKAQLRAATAAVAKAAHLAKVQARQAAALAAKIARAAATAARKAARLAAAAVGSNS